jgi:hypothetical protein
MVVKPTLLKFVFLVVALGLLYGGLDLAGAAPGSPGPPTTTVIVGNTATSPVPVQEQGTVTVDAGFETQLLLNQVVHNNDRTTLDVSAYKTVLLYFQGVSGSCFGSGAELLALETSGSLFLVRGRIEANDACTGGFTGETIEMPGRSLTLIPVIPNANDTWRVVAFGRAN